MSRCLSSTRWTISEPVAAQVEASLKRLELEATDLFVFHGCSKMEDWEHMAGPGGGMEQLERCRQQGKDALCGISSHNPEVLVAAINTGRCDVVMFPIGPYADERDEQVVLPLAQEKQVGTVCFKTFGGKLLGDTSGYARPLANRPRGKVSSGGKGTAQPLLPRLSVDECLHYTLRSAGCGAAGDVVPQRAGCGVRGVWAVPSALAGRAASDQGQGGRGD